MSKINKILEYGLLSELAYLRLKDEWFKVNNKYVNEGIGKYSYDEQGSLKNKENVVQFLNGKDIYGNIKINSKNKPLSKYVIAFRGTSNTKDRMVDAAIANIFGAHNYQENEAIDFIEDMQKKHPISDSYSNLTLTGHSLGGI